MLTQICARIKNYFTDDKDKLIGDFCVIEGRLVPSVPLQKGQHYRIVGSVFNDGVHGYDDVLIDEDEFHGGIWLMKVPKKLIAIAKDMQAWQSLYGGAESTLMGPYQSESFGGYTYSKASGTDSSGGSSSSVDVWDVFKSELDIYRKIQA